MNRLIEEWRAVENWEGLYEVSNLGRVRSLRTERVLIPQRTGTDGKYLGVDFSLAGKYKRYLLHRLVANAFIPNPTNLRIVNHLDGNTTNCTVTNLEWTTTAENTQHAYDSGLCNGRRIPVVQYKNDIKVARYSSVPEAAKALGVCNSSIRNVCGGFSKTCKGFIFRYDRKD